MMCVPVLANFTQYQAAPQGFIMAQQQQQCVGVDQHAAAATPVVYTSAAGPAPVAPSVVPSRPRADAPATAAEPATLAAATPVVPSHPHAAAPAAAAEPELRNTDVNMIPETGLEPMRGNPPLPGRTRHNRKVHDHAYHMQLSQHFERAKSATLSWTPMFTTFPSMLELRLKPGMMLRHKTIQEFLRQDSADHGGRAMQRWTAMISKAYPELSCDCLPDMLLRLLARCLQIRSASSTGGTYHFIEFCSGQAQVTFQLLKMGLVGLAFDKAYSDDHDMTTPAGLRLWIDKLSQTKYNSLNWFGTTCSPFVSLCKAQSKRHADNEYLGDGSKMFVRIGNLQMEVTSLMMYLSWLFGNNPLLEQPLNSVMPLCQPLKPTLSYIKAVKTVTWHQAFGGDSPKPLQLLTPNASLAALRRRKPLTSNNTQLAQKNGTKYSGNKKALKASQAYSAAFGKAVADIVETWGLSDSS